VEALAFEGAAGTSGSLFFLPPNFRSLRMRALILIAGAALTLAACHNNRQSDNMTNADENLTAENIVSNDVTAIDAVTGDASNMAADINYANTEDNSVANLGDNGTTTKATTKPRAKRPAATETPATTVTNAAG
jgi:hypothetical protein